MISIVLPSYNGEKYIEATIESVLQQTYREFELIVVNDASTDSTSKIIEKYLKKDNRVKVINNEINKKLPYSLNIGFDNAKGNEFTWISDDNVFHEKALEEMHKKLYENPKIDFVYANYFLINKDNVRMKKAIITGPSDKIYLCNNIGACFLYKSKIHFELQGYDVSKYTVEDYDFWIRAFEKYKFGHIKKELYDYRIHSHSLTSTKKRFIQNETISLLKEKLLTSNGRKNKYRSDIYEQLSFICRELNDCTSSRKYYIKSVLSQPKKLIDTR